MILVDTPIWVDHLNIGDPDLVELLDVGEVLTHPFVIGELAVGNSHEPGDRARTARRVGLHRRAHRSGGAGDGGAAPAVGQGSQLVDAHLLASTRI
ncbi:MAG: hypothetical protein ABI131_07950, partial [Nostocoides sp.]